MKKTEFERLKHIAIERIEEQSAHILEDHSKKDLEQLIQINEIYQAELEAQNEELQSHIIDLEEAQNELQILFSQAPIAYLLITKKFNVLRANERAHKLFGVDTIYSKNIPFYAYLHKKSITVFIDWINTENSKNETLEILLKTTSGLRYCQLHSHKWNDGDDKTFLISIQDIHQEKEENEKFKSLFKNSQQGIIFFDNLYKINNLNQTALDILEKDKDNLYDKHFSDIDIVFFDEFNKNIYSEDLPFVIAMNTQKSQSEKILSIKSASSGEFRYLNIEVIPHFNIENESLLGVFCLFTDITKEYALKKNLNQELSNFKNLSNNIPDPIIRVDTRLNILFVNKHALNLIDTEKTTEINQNLLNIEIFSKCKDKNLLRLLNDLDKVSSTITYTLNQGDTKKNYFIRIIPEDSHNSITFLIIIEDITKRVETENMFNQLFNNSSDAIMLTEHRTGRVRSINKKAKRLLEIDDEDITEYSSENLFESFSSKKLFSQHIHTLDTDGEDSYETTKTLKNGNILYLKIYCTLINIGDTIYHQSIVHDLTDHKLLERQLNQTSKVFEHTIEGIMVTDLKGRIISVNDAFSKITGFSREDIISHKPSMLKSGKHDKSFYKNMWASILKDGLWKGEIWNRKKDGTMYPEWLAISTIFDENNLPMQYVAVFSDFSEMKKNQLQLEELAHYDTLTRLPNRLLLHKELDVIIKTSKRLKLKFAVLFIDLDRFKNINDIYGHHIGDEVLKETAFRLKSLLRESDLVSRLGGDEFVVVLYDINSQESINFVASNILSELEKPFIIKNKEHFISGSIGISIYPDDSDTVSSLLKFADIAMYESKNSGKNQYSSFSIDMSDRVNSLSNLHNDLNQALINKEFFLLYQAQYDMINKKIYGFEALLRWDHPVYKNWSPEIFVKYAEESMHILQIGNWVLEQAIIDILQIQKVLKEELTISVNVSNVQLNQDFVHYLEYISNKYKNISSLVKLEITETSAMKNLDITRKIISQIKQLGFQISLDDFGTGYSALNAIKILRVDEIKIDKSFISDVPGNKDDEELVSSIIAMAKVMRKKIIAEGVETEITKNFLLERRCSYIQGYLISKPIPLEEVLEKYKN